MKCQTCTGKNLVWGLGFCKRCGGTTPSNMYRCCDKCAQDLQQCQVCGIGMGPGASSSSSNTTSKQNAYLVKVIDRNNGQTIKGVRVGELIEITLEEDQYSGKEWGIKNCPAAFDKQDNGVFTQNPQNPQYGVRTFTFACKQVDIASLELHEVQRSYGYGYWGGGGGTTPVNGGKTFAVTIEVM